MGHGPGRETGSSFRLSGTVREPAVCPGVVRARTGPGRSLARLCRVFDIPDSQYVVRSWEMGDSEAEPNPACSIAVLILFAGAIKFRCSPYGHPRRRAASAVPKWNALPLRCRNLCGMVGVSLPFSNKGKSGTCLA